MDGNIVKLVFQTIAAGSGFAQVSQQTSELQKKLGKLSQGAQVLGSALGSVGGMFGRSLAMLLQGGIWGAAAEVVKFVIEKTGVLKQKTDELNKSLEMTMKQYEAIKEKFQDSIKSIDEETQRKKRNLEITEKQRKAELELAAAKAKARGDNKTALSIANQITELETKNAKEREKLTVDAAKKKVDAARHAAKFIKYVDSEGNFDAKSWSKDLRGFNGAIQLTRMAFKQQYEDSMHFTRTYPKDLYTRGEDLEKRLNDEKEAKKQFVETAKKSREIAKNLKDALQELKDAKAIEEATKNSENAKSVNAATTLAQGQIELEKKNPEVKKASQATANESQGNFRERFIKAFDLWRDPAKAQEEQDAAKAKAEDLKRFQKSVDRYGGKWRIDEAAKLMLNGDEAGLQERLAEWRKSSKFNGQTEQMVLAAAARQNVGSKERTLKGILDETASIKATIDEIKKGLLEDTQ